MKSKHKNAEQIYHSIVARPVTELVKKIVENDQYLDSIESKLISLNDNSAVIEIAYTRNGVKTAAQKVNLLQHDHLSTAVSVYPIYQENQHRSSFFPLAFFLIFLLTAGTIVRSLQFTPITIIMSLMVLAVFAYFGTRYLEENSGKLAFYSQDDGKLLLNMLRLSLMGKEEEKRETLEIEQPKLKKSEIEQPELEKIEPARREAKPSPELRLEDMEAANLDDETLLERKDLHRKLEDLD